MNEWMKESVDEYYRKNRGTDLIGLGRPLNCIGDTLIRNFTGLICLLGPFQLAIHMVQNRRAGEQIRTETRQIKGITI